MSSNLTPRPRAHTAAPADGDNRFKAVQAKLKTLTQAMDEAATELAALHRGMQANADRVEKVSADIANADLDPTFVEMTSQASLALGGAAIEARKLDETGQEVATLAHSARRSHSRLYQGLDEVRSGRRERTPKPGFFTR